MKDTLIAWFKSRNWSTVLLWGIYLSLLAVLLPHTQWAFSNFEPDAWKDLGWLAALAFEGAILAFTWKLKRRIEETPKFRKRTEGKARFGDGPAWRKFSYRYLNIYSVGLLVAIGVSGAANWAHAVEFGKTFAVFGAYSVPPLVYAVAFGAILPACSLLFARILADVQDTEPEQDEAVLAAKTEIKELRRQLANAELLTANAERRAAEAEAAAKGLLRLVAEDKASRILAAREMWPQLKPAAIAVIAGAAPSYVSDVLSEVEVR